MPVFSSLVTPLHSRKNKYKGLFPALAQVGVLPEDFAQRLAGMAKFRNVLVHLYLEVDLRRLYRYLQENLDDFETFARYVAEWLQVHGEG